MSGRRIPSSAAAVALVITSGFPALAQESTEAQDSVIIEAGEGSGNSGRVAINIAAGNGNQQAGAANIAIGDVAVNSLSLTQLGEKNMGGERATLIEIGPGAFSNNNGMLSLNITAGEQNQSANLASLSIANSGVLSDQVLAQSSAHIEPDGTPGPGSTSGNDTIALSSDAFSDGTGLVQVNLVGGERNSSANTFVLNVSAGGEQ